MEEGARTMRTRLLEADARLEDLPLLLLLFTFFGFLVVPFFFSSFSLPRFFRLAAFGLGVVTFFREGRLTLRFRGSMTAESFRPLLLLLDFRAFSEKKRRKEVQD